MWVTDILDQQASGPHVTDTTAPVVKLLKLSPVNAALRFWRDGDRFRREARASDGRGFGRPGRSDAGVVVKCELMDDEPLKRMRHNHASMQPLLSPASI